MESKELYETAGVLVSKLESYRKNQTLQFDSIDQKMKLVEIFKVIYPDAKLDLSCSICVVHCLNMLEAWYERENPKYLQTLEAVVEAPVTPAEPIQTKKLKPKQNGQRNGTS